MIQHLIGDKGESTILIANEATKNNLQQKITDNTYQFVHLATHSMVNFDDPRVSAIACYQVNNSENLYL
ncbi:MAG: CHAT domain-containing protein, partial [Saprospiraceae bacterium]